jgi:hypothetical protein
VNDLTLPLRVAFIGAPGSGKSAIADAWLARHKDKHIEGNTFRLSFAWALKGELAEALAATANHEKDAFFRLVAEQKDPATKDKYRSLQQAWGQFRRDADEHYWLNKVLAIIDRVPETCYVAVDDCRFPNEEAALRERGFVFVHLLSGETTRVLTPEQVADESERYWAQWHADVVLPYVLGADEQAARLDAVFAGEEGVDGLL